MANQNYPYNLIRVVYNDPINDDTHTATTDADAFIRTIQTLTDREQLMLESHYRDGLTIKACGDIIGKSKNSTQTIINKALRKLRQDARKYYYNVNPATGTAPTAYEPLKKKAAPGERDPYPFNLLQAMYFNKADETIESLYLKGLLDEIEKLNPTYKTYVELRYKHALSRIDCGNRMNLSEYQVEQLERRVHAKLRDRKDDGFLTAVPLSQLTEAQQRIRELERENRAYKQLVSGIANGSIRPDTLVIHEPQTESDRITQIKQIPIDELDLSVRAYNALSRNRWDTVGHLMDSTRDDLSALRNIGVAVINEIVEKLSRYGVTLKDESQDDESIKTPTHSLTVGDVEKALHGEQLNIEIKNDCM